MTQRSILAGESPIVTVRGGGDVHIEGWTDDRVQAASNDKKGLKVERHHHRVEITAGGSLDVKVPLASVVDVSAQHNVDIHGVRSLARATAGNDMHIDCEAVEGSDSKFEAGGDVRFYVHDLSNAKLVINDLGGQWEVSFGDERTTIQLKAGGDVTLVSNQKPDKVSEVFGQIETPVAAAEPNPG
jgi:hypothetical protein